MSPPDPVRVVLLPAHIADGAADAVIVAFGLMVTVTEAVPVHPAALVPVT